MNYSYNLNLFIFIISICAIIISIIINNIDDIPVNQSFLIKINDEEDLLNIIKKKENELKQLKKEERITLEKEIQNIYEEIEKLKEKRLKKIKRSDGKLMLTCAYALNNGYIYPTFVSMTSLAKNAGNNTFYNIYILASPDFTEKNAHILKSVEQKYSESCKVNIKKMGEEYKGKDTNINIPIAAYYRLDLHNILPDIDRILYMDGDTLIFQDLSELITLDMKGNYILGFLDNRPRELEYYNIKDEVILCSGVLLMDLYALRKHRASEKIYDFLESNTGNIYQHDQTTINIVFRGKISTLPPKYGMWNFEFVKEAIEHNNIQFSWIKYDDEEFLKGYYKPAILHYTWGKPFKLTNKKPSQVKYYNEWWKYANETEYNEDIYKYANKSLYLVNKIILFVFLFIILY